MQGVHCTSDAPYVLARLGPQRAAEGAYAWQKLMKSGAIVSNGTMRRSRIQPDRQLLRDCEPQARRRFRVLCRSAHEPRQGAEVVHHPRRLRRVQEESKGTLKVGKYADLDVLSKDILTGLKARFRRRR